MLDTSWTDSHPIQTQTTSAFIKKAQKTVKTVTSSDSWVKNLSFKEAEKLSKKLMERNKELHSKFLSKIISPEEDREMRENDNKLFEIAMNLVYLK